MAAMAGGGWGAHGSDDFAMYRVFKFTSLPIPLPGKQGNGSSRSRPPPTDRPRGAVSYDNVSFHRSPIHSELALDGMEWRGVVHL